MTGTAVFAYMESEKDGILKKIVPGCKIYVKIHLKMSERKVVWQMQRVKQHKWFLFILIGFIVISFFQFLPLTDTLHLYEKTPQSFELTAGGPLKYGIEGQNADQAGECELEEYHTDRLTGPEIAERQACGLPEETPAATLARTTQSEAALGEQNQIRTDTGTHLHSLFSTSCNINLVIFFFHCPADQIRNACILIDQ